MARGLTVVLMLVLGVSGVSPVGLAPPLAARAAGCAGLWLVHVTLDGRDIVDEAFFDFDDDGTIRVESAPILPALLGAGETALLASDGLGVWERTGVQTCAFEFVRLLRSDDGVGVGALNVRGLAEVDDAGNELTGSLTIVRATGFGQTAATTTGSFSGTPLDGPLLWLTPTP
jgi:hypothetical protein